VQLGFGTVERLLMHLHEVPAARRLAMRSRIQHLQRHGLPNLPAAGRGTRIVYDEDAVFQLVTAFELAGVNWPAQALTAFVRDEWKDLRPLVDLGLAARDVPDHELPGEYAIIHPDALAGIRSAAPAMVVERVTGPMMATWAMRGGMSTRASYIVLDLVSVGRRAARFLQSENG
jgi:hypothetical protein